MLSNLNNPRLICVVFSFLAVGILAIGLWQRIQFSNARIMHSDEAVQAYQLWTLMETGDYQYDPVDKHGPTLYYFAAFLNRLAGIEPDQLDDQNTRWLPIISGAALMVLLLAWNRRCDYTLLLAVALFAFSPFPIIYGSYFVQESLFVFLGFVTLYFANQYWFQPSRVVAICLGLAAGLLFATKETSVIHFFCIAVAIQFIAWRRRGEFKLSKQFDWRLLGTALLSFGFVWVVLFSSFFTHFDGLLDSVRSLFLFVERAEGQGHEKPWLYYLSLFWPHVAEGASWGELMFLIVAFLGLGVSLVRKSSSDLERSLQLLILYGFICFVVYSLIPYKTPWLMLTSYASFCLAAAYFIVSLTTLFREKWQITIIVIFSLFLVYEQAALAAQAKRYASDSRNPYIYQHTSSQFQKLIDRLETLEELDQTSPLEVAVVGDETAWPLAWYWRSSGTIGYWSEGDEVPNLEVVIKPASSREASSDPLFETHIVEYHGLRENVVLECWIGKRLWAQFMDTRE